MIIGLWLLFLVKYREKVKKFKEFNSPHNTSFFTLAILFTGLFYLYSGYYTDLLNWNLLEDYEFYFFLTPWIFFLSFPLLIAGLSYIFSCMKKYDVVYIYKSKSIKARKFGIFILFFVIINNIIFLSFIADNENFYDFYPNYTSIGLVLFIFILFSLALIIYGIAKKSKRSSEISQDLIRRRRTQIASISTSRPRSPPRRQQKPKNKSTRSRKTTSQQTKKKERSKPAPKPAPKPKPRPKPNASRERIIRELESLRPKATILSLEDFKCIFCFNLPKHPEDQNRGVVLCPHCKYPAHSDEFRGWMKNSPLCSRCNSKISNNFRQNPKIISTKKYSTVIKYFRKKEKLD